MSELIIARSLVHWGSVGCYQLNDKIFTSQTTEQDSFETLLTSTQGTHYKVTT